MKHLFKSLSVIALGLAALQAEAKFKVVTTFTVIQDIAQNVAGDAATVESITNLVQKFTSMNRPLKIL